VNCFDCAGRGHPAEAVAVCVGCGAGVCRDHACVAARWETTAALNHMVTVEPPARTIRCGLCQQAHDAASGHQSSAARQRGRS
jgi:hypothetical protein